MEKVPQQENLNPATALRNIELTLARDDVSVFNFRTVRALEQSFKVVQERLAEAEELETKIEELEEKYVRLERELTNATDHPSENEAPAAYPECEEDDEDA